MRLGIVLAVAAAIAVVGVSSATASRKPKASEKAALARAIHAPAKCLRIRIATVRHGWASVRFRLPPSRSCERYAADGVSVWRKRRHRWRFRFAGSSWSCPIPKVPETVRKDLRLGCPEGGP